MNNKLLALQHNEALSRECLRLTNLAQEAHNARQQVPLLSLITEWPWP